MRISLNAGGPFTISHAEGFGTVIKSKHGQISVLSNSPYSPAKHSITNFVVSESERGKGYGKELLDEAIRRYGEDLGGQASSKESVKLMYGLGFRMANNQHGTLEDALKAMKEDSSVYMRLKA